MLHLYGSFHQGSDKFHAESRGKQCIPNCIIFVALALIKSSETWTKTHLDFILFTGNELYKQIILKRNISHQYLLYSDLPLFFSFVGKTFLRDKGKNFSGSLTKKLYHINDYGMSLEFAFNLIFHSNGTRSVAILIFCDCSIAIKKIKDQYFIFDPHSRCKFGLLAGDGACHISKYNSLSALCSFLRDLAASLTSKCLDEIPYDMYGANLKVQEKHKEIGLYSLNVDGFESVMSEFGKGPNRRVSTSKMTTQSKAEKRKQTSPSNIPSKKLRRADLDTPLTLLIKKFTSSVQDGPLYVCTSCGQTWFKEGVEPFNTVKTNYNLLSKCTSGTKSFNNIEWICKTCKRYLMSGKVPECSIGNEMKFPTLPDELKGLSELEQRLISPRIPFMCIRQRPRGGQLCMKGNVVNVPADVNKTVRVLPRTLNDEETIFVKLKRKMSFKHSVLQELIRPNRVTDAVKFLVESNLFKSEGITLDPLWSMQNLTVNIDSEIESNSDSDNELCEKGDGWDEEINHENQPSGNFDTMLIPVLDYGEFRKTINLAPGEGNTPLGIFQDINSEFLAFPALYCGQARPPNNQRRVPLHYSTISKWELRHVDRRAAMCIPNLFFKMKKLQIKYIQDKIQLAVRKCKLQGKKITVQDVLAPGTADNLVKHNEGFQVLRKLRGSTAYWEAAKKDLFAMIRQLGIPHWFCSLSAAETKWESLLKTLGKLVDHKEYTIDDINNLSWFDKCRLINSDPVTCARYFDYRVQKFLHNVLISDFSPLGKIQDFFYRVEFQQRGSPHIHMVLWVLNGPDVANASDKDVVKFLDNHVTCANDEDIPELINYQMHRHARTCRKKGKAICRFNYPIPPMPKTVILHPIDIDQEALCLSTCKKNYDKIAEKLDEMKYGADVDFSQFLTELELTEIEYCNAIRSSLNKSKVFLKRHPSEIRINSYNSMMLKCWQANIDVQFVLDAYSCAAYIVSYISKGQKGMSNLMYSAVKEAKDNNLDIKHQLRHVGNKFLTHVEVSAQEAVYFVLQMPMRRSSRSFLFLNTSQPADRLILLKSTPVLEEMSNDSTDIEADNVIKRYQRRPLALNAMCLADFASWYNVSYPTTAREKRTRRSQELELPELNDQDCQDDNPEIDDDEDQFLIDETYEPNEINIRDEICLKDGGILKKRKKQKVLRYVRFNKDHDPENYYRELIMLFHPWRNEENDIPQSLELLFPMYNKHSVKIEKLREIYEKKRKVIEQVEFYIDDENEIINTDFMPENMHTEETDGVEGLTLSEKYGCFDPGKPENYDVGLDVGITRKQISDDDMVIRLPENEYRKLVRSLNNEQREFFDHIVHWFKTEDEPLYNFLSGGAGVGKSVTVTAIYQALIRLLNVSPGSNPDEVKVLLCAPTGKAAHNISGNTIHSTFCIPVNKGFCYKSLAMEQLNTYRLKYKNLKVVIIDEISMVGCKMFNFINCRLQEIMGNLKTFGGVSIITVGDLYQLKPVMDSWIFSNTTTEYGVIATNLWQDHFHLFELKMVMRQKEDAEFAALLNRLREGNHTCSDVHILKSRLVVQNMNDLSSVVHLFTTRAEVDEFNAHVFSLARSKSGVIECIDSVSGDVHETLHEKILAKIPNDPSKTMGLYKILKIAEGLNVEVSININVEDGLTNGANGQVMCLDYRVENSARCSIIWVLFDNKNIGKEQRCNYQHLRNDKIENTWTPILEVTRKFVVSNNSSYQIIRRQFPLRLSAAKTIHKSQGSSVDNVVVHFGKRRNSHMHYVGLSRVRSLKGLHILQLSEEKICVSPEVIMEMERMRTSSYLITCVPKLPSLQSNINIVFHNVRSLHLHIEDIRKETYLEHVDMFAVCESRLKSDDKDNTYVIRGFSLFRNDAERPSAVRPYHGTVLYARNSLQSHLKTNSRGIEITSSCIEKQGEYVRVLFVYCPPKLAIVNNYRLMMEHLCTFITEKTVIMGDFNFDMKKDHGLNNLMNNYGFTQVLREDTTDYCTMIDGIYVNFCHNRFNCGTFDSYFSDHKPVFISIPVL